MTRYSPGAWNAICQRTGFKVKSYETREEWNGLRVRKHSLDPRHPQDLLRGIPDDPSTEWARPRTYAYTKSPNVLTDYNGLTSDRWILNSTWILNSGDGWRISPDNFAAISDNLATSRAYDLVIGEPIAVGDTVTLSGTITLSGYVGGTLAGKLICYDSDRATIASTLTALTVSANSATRVSGSVVIPTCSYIQVVWDADTLEGSTCTIRNVKLEIGGLTDF